MDKKTPLIRVLLGRCRTVVGLLVLTVFLILGILTVVKPQIASAVSPSNLNFQARLMTSGGGIVPDGNYNVEFKLYNTATVTGTPDQGACTRNGGTAEPACLWVETRTSGNVVTVKNGYLTVNLGSVTAFGAIDWSQQMWLTMRIGGIGTPSWDAEMSPRLQLTATPFAMYAANAATLGGLTSSQFIQNTTSPQASSNFNISGTGTAGTSLLTPLLDTASGVALNVGTTNATVINLNQNTTLAAGKSLTLSAGTGTITQTLNTTSATSGYTLNLTNTSGTQTNGISIVRNGASGTTTNGINVTSTAGTLTNGLAITTNGGTIGTGVNITNTSGTLTNGISLNGTFTNLINSTNFTVSNAGAITANGSATIQGTAAASILTLKDSGGAIAAGFDSTGQLFLGRASGATGSLKLNNATNANTVTIQSGVTTTGYTLTLPTALGSSGNCLADTTGAGVLGFVSCGGGGGVTSVGAISGTSNANGATITGSVLNLTAADGSNGGVVINGTQTFGGDKTFNGSVSLAANQSLTLAAGTGTISQTYNGTAAGTANTINMTNTSGANTNGLLINRNGASGTTTSGINVTNTAGTLTNGLSFTGTIGTDINRGTGTLSLNGASGINFQAGGSTITSITASGSSTTGTLSATGAISGVGINSGSGLIQGTGGLTLTGATSINASTNAATNINTGTSNGLVSIGGGSGTFALDTTNIDISSTGAITGATGVSLASGNFVQNGAGTFSTGQGTVSLNGNTTIGDATTDRLTVTAQLLGGSPLVFQGATDNSFATTLALVDPTANNTITLPNASGTVAVSASGPLSLNATSGALSLGTVGFANGGTNATSYTTNGVVYSNGTSLVSTAVGATNQCLKGNTGAAPTWGTCGTATTMQDSYDNSGSTNPQIQLSSGNGGLKIRDASTTVGNLLQLQNSAGTVTYFAVTATGMSIQNSTGTNFAFESGTNPHLKIYNPASGLGRYSDIYFDSSANSGNGEAVFASVGSGSTTRVGNGSGNIAMQLTNTADVLTFSKTASLSGAYSANDFTVSRVLTSGANTETGSVLKVESTGTGSAAAPNLLLINQANTSAGGNLIAGQYGGVNKFQVAAASGNITAAGSLALGAGMTLAGGIGFTGAQTISTTTGNLTLTAGGANSVIVKPGTDNTAAFQVQDAASVAQISVDTTNDRIQLGSSTTDAVAIKLVLDSYNQSSDPAIGANGSMYYNTSMAKFRCQENGAWTNCITALPVSIYLGSDSTMASTSPANVGTGFNFSLAANTKYHYRFVIMYQSTSASVGLGFGVTTPASPTVNQWCTDTISVQSTAPTAGMIASYCGTGDATTQFTTALASPNTTYEQVLEGYIQNGSNTGNLQLRVRAETTGATITVKAGTWGILTPVQ